MLHTQSLFWASAASPTMLTPCACFCRFVRLPFLLRYVAQERGYVVKSGRTLVPSPLGRLLTAYLTIHFTEYVDVNFTAKVEEQLDEVSGALVGFEIAGQLDGNWREREGGRGVWLAVGGGG